MLLDKIFKSAVIGLTAVVLAHIGYQSTQDQPPDVKREVLKVQIEMAAIKMQVEGMDAKINTLSSQLLTNHASD